MIKLSSLSLFFPVHNEEKNIIKVVASAQKIARQISHSYEIIIVDDGSTDKTVANIKKNYKNNSTVKIISHHKNLGYGAALKSGIKHSAKDWIFFSDGDNQFDLSELNNFLPYTRDYDVIIGYRPKRSEGPLREMNANLWSFLNRAAFGLNVKDVDCAFKLFRRQRISSIDLISNGAMLSAEFLIKLKNLGVKFQELPVKHQPRQEGQSSGANPLVILRAFKEFGILYSHLKLNRHNQFLKFALVGALGTILDISLLNLTHLVFHFNLYIATSLGFIAGTLNNYLLNTYWTFRQQFTLKQLLQFTLIGGSGLLLNDLIVYVFVEKFSLYYNFAKIIAVGIIFFWNYFLNRYWTFKKQN